MSRGCLRGSSTTKGSDRSGSSHHLPGARDHAPLLRCDAPFRPAAPRRSVCPVCDDSGARSPLLHRCGRRRGRLDGVCRRSSAGATERACDCPDLGSSPAVRKRAQPPGTRRDRRRGRTIFSLPFVDPPAKTGVSPEPETIRNRNRALEYLGFPEKVSDKALE